MSFSVKSLPLRLMRTIPASRTSISIVRMYKTSITNNRNFYLTATDKNQNSKPPQKSQLFRKTVNALARFFEKFPQLPPGQWREKQSIKSPYPEVMSVLSSGTKAFPNIMRYYPLFWLMETLMENMTARRRWCRFVEYYRGNRERMREINIPLYR